jgi:hypothetical protein
MIYAFGGKSDLGIVGANEISHAKGDHLE